MKLRVGFIGLGEMGRCMALNIIRAGFPLTVYDIRQEAVNELTGEGAVPAGSPAEVAGKSDCVMLSLPDTSIVEQVLWGENGLAHGLRPGSTVVDLSTISYLSTIEIEKKLGSSDVTFIDAPVSGQPERAREGTLTVMIGGNEEAVKQVRPVLETIGKEIVYMGKSGNGQLAKLTNQLLYNISFAAMAEVLPMAVKLGLDPEAICRVVTTGTGQTYALSFFAPYILDNKFDRAYSLASAYKDMISAAEISAREQIPMPVFCAALQTYQLALAQGLGNESKAAMIKVWENAIGVEVRRKERPN